MFAQRAETLTLEQLVKEREESQRSQTIESPQSLLVRGGIRGEDLTRTLESYDPRTGSQREAKKLIEEAATSWKSQPSSFYIWGAEGTTQNEQGAYGTGKSHLAKALCIRLAHRYFVKPYYTTSCGFVRQLKDSWYNEDVTNPLTQAKEAGIVVIDDIDKESSIDESVDHNVWRSWWDMWTYITDQKIPFVVTSNLSPKELKDWQGGSMHDRIITPATVLHICGPSGRMELYKGSVTEFPGGVAPWAK
jgi:DNA replication protein DnaC